MKTPLKTKDKKIVVPQFEELIPLLISQWRKLQSISGGPPDLLQTREFRSASQAIKNLHLNLFTGDGLHQEKYLDNKDHLGAYLLYYFAIHYAQGLSLLGELPFTPSRVLDLCAGPAPFSLAALKHGAGEVIAIDRCQKALEIGAEISGRLGHPLTIRPWAAERSPLPEGLFDLIIVGYALEELFPQGSEEKQHLFIQKLLNKLTSRGVLLIVSPSWPEANQRILKLRDRIVKENVHVLAPCVCQNECPILKAKGEGCYAQREFEKPFFLKELQRGAEINLSSLKMSYLMLRHPEYKKSPHSSNLFRVISPAINPEESKHYYLCGKEGKKSVNSTCPSTTKEIKAFDYLKRGDLIRIENSIEGRTHLTLNEKSSLKIESACGKPAYTEETNDS